MEIFSNLNKNEIKVLHFILREREESSKPQNIKIISNSLGVNITDVSKTIEGLKRKGKIKNEWIFNG